MPKAAQQVKSKNPFFHNFFYFFNCNDLAKTAPPKTPKFSHQTRMFALLREGVCFRDAMKNETLVYLLTFHFYLFTLCLSAFVAEIQSIKNNKLCKTNPISRMPKLL